MNIMSNKYKNAVLQYLGDDITDILIDRNLFFQFIAELQKQNVFIENIMWWEHKLKESKSDISLGGPIDERDERYIWGECCDLVKWFDSENIEVNKVEVLNYLKDIENQKLYLGLVPSVSIRKELSGFEVVVGDEKNVCPVCGFEGLDEPSYDEFLEPSCDICPCCGVEFGFDDLEFNNVTFVTARNNWLKNGAKWFNKNEKPKNWNLEEQLKNTELPSIKKLEKRLQDKFEKH